MTAVDPVLEGLAVNPALPEELLLRLVADGRAADGLAARASLPAAVVAAMLDHPAPRMRAAVGSNTSVDPQTRLSLLNDPDPWVRSRLEKQRELPLPEWALSRIFARLARSVDRGLLSRQEMLGEVFDEAGRERRLRPLLVRHEDEQFRLIACHFTPYLDEPDQQALLHDESPTVRAAAAAKLYPPVVADLNGAGGYERVALLGRPLTRELIEEVLAAGDEEDLLALARNTTLPADVVAALVTHDLHRVRRETARRDDLTSTQAVRLGADPDPSVRAEVSVHPVLTEAQRAVIAVPPETTFCGCESVPVVPGQSAVWARSVNPLLRRRAAADPLLPAEIAAVLADDPDAVVRGLLAVHHPAAPPALKLRTFLEHDGCARRRLLFPVTDSARFATSPDAAVRQLVARDPDADPALVEQLLTDPDESVRRVMAGCARLPVHRIVALLDDPELSAAAAANPSLPRAEMERLIRRAEGVRQPPVDARRADPTAPGAAPRTP